MLRRKLAAVTLAFASLAGSAAAAPGAPNESASCLAAFVTFETQLGPGVAGAEQKALAPHSAGAVGALASTFAQAHGSLEGCPSG